MSVDGEIGFEVRRDRAGVVIVPRGDWLTETVGAIDAQLRRLEAEGGAAAVDLSGLGRVDTSGAYVLSRLLRAPAGADPDAALIGEHSGARALMALVRDSVAPSEPAPEPGPGFIQLLERAGRGLQNAVDTSISTLGFFGEIVAAAGRGIVRPHTIRWAPTFHVMEQAGLNALPIVATLSFFVGAVIAYLGANILQQFGVELFAVELVVFSVLREFGVVITAIMLAGRSDSAFTAQIGSMRMQQEIDAMRVLGLDPVDALVLPRVIACLVMTPLLTFGAMMMGIFGGMMVLWMALDIAPGAFVVSMQNVPIQHFWVGMSKAPVFALVIATIGCRHGLEVENDVESLGKRVTASVVQSIFSVIVIDAVFAMIYLELDI